MISKYQRRGNARNQNRLAIYTAILLVVLLFVLSILACGVVPEGSGTGTSFCADVWINCSGVADDSQVCNDCYVSGESVENGIRYFSVVYCTNGSTARSSVTSQCSLQSSRP